MLTNSKAVNSRKYRLRSLLIQSVYAGTNEFLSDRIIVCWVQFLLVYMS